MYGSSDDHWDSEYFLMRDIANEQNAFLKEILLGMNDPDMVRKIALAIIEFSTRIKSASN